MNSFLHNNSTWNVLLYYIPLPEFYITLILSTFQMYYMVSRHLNWRSCLPNRNFTRKGTIQLSVGCWCVIYTCVVPYNPCMCMLTHTYKTSVSVDVHNCIYAISSALSNLNERMSNWVYIVVFEQQVQIYRPQNNHLVTVFSSYSHTQLSIWRNLVFTTEWLCELSLQFLYSRRNCGTKWWNIASEWNRPVKPISIAYLISSCVKD